MKINDSQKTNHTNDFLLVNDVDFQNAFPLIQAAEFIPEIILHGRIRHNKNSFQAAETELGLEQYHFTMSLESIANRGVGYFAGQCMARWIIDHPKEFKGKKIVDVGSGSGIVAIAAATAGARCVIAMDNDPVALDVIRRNARANHVDIHTHHGYFSTTTQQLYPDYGIVTACDMFYSGNPIIENALINFAKEGGTVLAASFIDEAPALAQAGVALKIPAGFKRRMESLPCDPLALFHIIDRTSIQSQECATQPPISKRSSYESRRDFLRDQLKSGWQAGPADHSP